MEVVIYVVEYDECFLLDVPSRPNTGDFIRLHQFNIENISPELKQEIDCEGVFEVHSVTLEKSPKFEKAIWSVNGDLDTYMH